LKQRAVDTALLFGGSPRKFLYRYQLFILDIRLNHITQHWTCGVTMQTEPEQPLIRLPGLAQLLAAFFWLSLLLMFIPLGLDPLTPHINRFKLAFPHHVLQLSQPVQQPVTASTPETSPPIVAKMSVKERIGLCYHRLDFAAVNTA
jgi:hypothetical protein